MMKGDGKPHRKKKEGKDGGPEADDGDSEKPLGKALLGATELLTKNILIGCGKLRGVEIPEKPKYRKVSSSEVQRAVEKKKSGSGGDAAESRGEERRVGKEEGDDAVPDEDEGDSPQSQEKPMGETQSVSFENEPRVIVQPESNVSGEVTTGVVDAGAQARAASSGEGPFRKVGKTSSFTDGRGKDVVTLPPIVEFLVRDSTILTAAGFTASVLTYRHWSFISEDRALPLSVAAAWLVLAYLLGQKSIFEYDLVAKEMMAGAPETSAEEEMVVQEEDISTEDLAKLVGKELAAVIAEQEAADAALPAAEGWEETRAKLRPMVERKGGDLKLAGKSRRHTFFLMAAGKMSVCRIHFREEKAKEESLELPNGFWTNLLDMPLRKRQTWENNFTITCDRQMERLLRDPGQYRRKKVEGKDVIEPLLKFRGIDVFLSDYDEVDLYKSSILTRCGLRDQPIFMIHLLCPFANIVTYLELPEWATKSENIQENEDDPDDVKALKRFLKGDDEYRNKRLKIYPCLVNGPMMVRMAFHPPSKEFTIWGTMLPLVWHMQSATTGRDGRKKSSVMEACVDVVSNNITRNFARLLGSSLKGITMDIAAVIGTPDGQEEKEPEACLGMWRYDQIDLETCPKLPRRTKSERLKDASELRSTLVISAAAG